MAQSKVMRTDFESKFMIVSNLASSWLTERSKWAFEVSIYFLDCETMCAISSFSSFGMPAFFKDASYFIKNRGN